MRKKEDSSITLLKWLIGIVVFLIVFVIGVYYFYNNDERLLEKELKDEGYQTEKDNSFFNKIVSNNTLDDYYKDISLGKNSYYEEYYVSKESNDFIELKMTFQDNISTTINIISDFKTNVIKYNLEVSYDKSHIIIEGNSDNQYQCNVIVEKNVKKETIDYYCNSMVTEINSFINKRTELLNNQDINKRIK